MRRVAGENATCFETFSVKLQSCCQASSGFKAVFSGDTDFICVLKTHDITRYFLLIVLYFTAFLDGP